MQLLTRAAVLRYGAGAALGLSASAPPPPDSDLAFARLLVATELLADDFYSHALDARVLDAGVLHEARANERAHYAGLAAIMNGLGQPPAQAGDIDFSYPRGAFTTAASLRRLGAALETLQLGAYLGAADGLGSEPLRVIATRISANEAQHLTVFEPFHASFPVALTVEQASDALAVYTS
jgi:hypothetical protein